MQSVNILGEKYKIIRKLPPALTGGIDSEGLNFVALFMGIEKQIYVSSEVNNEEYHRALLHEMGHAVMYRNGVHFSGAVTMEIEEIIVETFASANYEYICTLINKWLKYDDSTIREQLQAFVSRN